MSDNVNDVLVSPGQRIGSATDYLAGPGAYARGDAIHASLVGRVAVAHNGEGKAMLRVLSDEGDLFAKVPEVGSIVTVKVTIVTPKYAKVSILCVGAFPLRDEFRGLIRSQDVRATEKDSVEIYKCFRPGDIVAAEVISLGDARSYYLSTARNELGVVHATSEAGVRMTPVSWCEMQCPKTMAVEQRKVAKVM